MNNKVTHRQSNSTVDIVFYQQRAVPYLGIISLTSNLDNNGFRADIVIDQLENDPVKTIQNLKPRLIGLSVFSVEHSWLIEAIDKIRRVIPDIPIIVGGIHAMLYPQEILNSTEADFVCHSDGEEVLVNLLGEIVNGSSDWASIKGLAYRDRNNNIIINSQADLYQYQNDTIESKHVYYNRYPALMKSESTFFLSSRGCPYSCSFCYNDVLRELFKNKGRYIRRKNIKNIISEIKADISMRSVKVIVFADDLFTTDISWLKDFLELYKKEISLPFTCSTRANVFNEDTAQLLADAGCVTVYYGIETGDEKLRTTVLKKNVTDEEILRCGNLLDTYGITSMTFNMFCLPDETIDSALKTVEINIAAKTKLAFTSLLLPFPGTALAEYCKRNHYIEQEYSMFDLPQSYFFSSSLNLKDKKYILNVHYLAYWFIKYPVIYKFAKKVVFLKRLNKLLFVFFLCGLFDRVRTMEKRSWVAMIRHSVSNLRFLHPQKSVQP